MLPLVFDDFQTYEGYFANPARCRLRIYAVPGQRAVAIATELPDNPGTSITNRADTLATLVMCKAALMFGTDPGDIVWVEHYPARPHDPMEAFRVDRYARVTFDWDDHRAQFVNSQWKHMTREEVDELIGLCLGGEAPAPSRN
jgi:hypothetical protein